MKTFRQFLKGYSLWVFFFSLSPTLFGQINESFSDGDFHHNPAWLGDTTLFIVNDSLQLQTNGLAQSNQMYLSTPYSRQGLIEWRIDLNYPFAPSSTNYLRIYLVSNQADLTDDLNGYYLQVGESGSNDSYNLYRQDGNQSTLLIDGIDSRAGSAIQARVKIIRQANGQWQLFTDPLANGTFELEGTATDSTYQPGGFFGVWVKHTASRKDQFIFDNIYIGDEILDTIPPTLISGLLINEQTIKLQFSEKLDSSVTISTNYRLLPSLINPITAIIDTTSPEQVSLTFPTSFVSPNSYQVIIEQITDLNGNQMITPDTFAFEYIVPEIADYKDIIINEILPDPTPSLGLPESEFIELYNKSQKIINLENWTLSNGSTVGHFPEYLLHPETYLIICPTEAKSEFSPHGPVLSPDKWPALVNSQDHIGLRSQDDLLIDTLTYQAAWWGDSSQDGKTLELIYPDNLNCPVRTNWTASQDSIGGTPGKVNSTHQNQPDLTPLEITSTHFADQYSVIVCLNKSLSSADAIESKVFRLISSSVIIPDSLAIVNEDFTCLELLFTQPIEKGKRYSLSVQGLFDCSGQSMTDTLIQSLILGETPQPFDIILTEIMVDYSPPRFLPEAEFVEIFNRTDKILDLTSMTISDGVKTSTIDNQYILPKEYIILCGAADTDKFASLGKVIGLQNFPSLDNRRDSLFLRNDSLDMIDFLAYKESWYQHPEKQDGGWSLERLDLEFFDCNHPKNWQASNNQEGGTPGQSNSHQQLFEDHEAPSIVSLQLVNDYTLTLIMNEPISSGLETINNYLVDHQIGEPLLATANPPFQNQVVLTFDQAFDSNQVYTLKINQLEDCKGNRFSGEIGFGIPNLPSTGDILINEILFNPYSGGSDFVEIINHSDRVFDLADILIGEMEDDSIFNSNIVSKENRLILPGEMICLTKDVLFQQQIYHCPPHAQFHGMADFPTYDDREGEAVIFNRKGETLDRFAYSSDDHYSTLTDQNGVSLERISLQQSAADPQNWHSAGSAVHYATPGYRNSQAISEIETPTEVSLAYQVFTPNGDGEKDVLPINYHFDFPGAQAQVMIFDTQGRKIKRLIPGDLLSSEPGTYFWDGTNEKNQKADLGMYVIVFEVVNQHTGERFRYRLVGVLGAFF